MKKSKKITKIIIGIGLMVLSSVVITTLSMSGIQLGGLPTILVHSPWICYWIYLRQLKKEAAEKQSQKEENSPESEEVSEPTDIEKDNVETTGE